MKYFVWGFLLLLTVLHQDVWYWGDQTLWFGFLPTGLLYHVGLSLAAVWGWFLAVKFCWPQTLDEAAASADEAEPTA